MTNILTTGSKVLSKVNYLFKALYV